MMVLLEMTDSGKILSGRAEPEQSKVWPRFRFRLLRDVLPTLVILTMVGGLTLTLVEYLDGQRSHPQVVVVSGLPGR